MWPLPRVRDEYFQVVLHSEQISCIRFSRQEIVPSLIAYEAYSLPVGTYQNIYAIELLRSVLKDFIKREKLEQAFVTFILGKDFVSERLSFQTHGEPNFALQAIDLGEHDHHQLFYIGPSSNGFLFYCGKAAQAVLFQWELVVQRLPVHGHAVILPFYAQYNLYKYIAGSAFVPARLVQDLDAAAICIPMLFSSEFVRRSIVGYDIIQDRMNDVVYALGAFIGVSP